MTTQYNIVTYGNLTNNNGVLSGFSPDNYATIPLNFNPTQKPYEVVFKFSGTNGVIWNVGDPTTARGHVEFEIYQSKLYSEFAVNSTLIWSIEGITTILANTDYWAKLTYNGVDTYGLYLSTDGTTWNAEGTATSSDFLGDGSTQYNLIGCQTDNGVITYSFNGSIDLNESYISIDNIRWWQGATTISNVRTKVQLRHDTAANWTSVNPTLLEGEVGIETDTRKQKFGDGVTAWNSLPYDKGSTALQSIASSDVTTALGYTPVNKAGDTMSGGLTAPTLTTSQIGIGSISLKNITSGNFSDVTFYDNNNIRTGFVRGNNKSSTQNFLQLSAVKKDNVVGATLTLDNNNGTASANINTTLTVSNLISNGYLTTSGDINLGGAGRMNLKVNGTSKGTTPSSDCYQAFLFNDTDDTHTTWQDMRFGAVETQVLNTGENRMILSVYRNEAGSTAGATMTLGTSSSGNWCTFPNTTCCDGQWVYSYSFLTNSVAATKTTISLSSYLPNNNYNYEVMGVFGRDNVNSAEKYLVSSDLFNPQFNTTSGQFCVSFITGGYTRANNTSFILPVGAGRCLYTIGSDANTGSMYLYVLGYRRIGTNA